MFFKFIYKNIIKRCPKGFFYPSERFPKFPNEIKLFNYEQEFSLHSYFDMDLTDFAATKTPFENIAAEYSSMDSDTPLGLIQYINYMFSLHSEDKHSKNKDPEDNNTDKLVLFVIAALLISYAVYNAIILRGKNRYINNIAEIKKPPRIFYRPSQKAHFKLLEKSFLTHKNVQILVVYAEDIKTSRLAAVNHAELYREQFIRKSKKYHLAKPVVWYFSKSDEANIRQQYDKLLAKIVSEYDRISAKHKLIFRGSLRHFNSKLCDNYSNVRSVLINNPGWLFLFDNVKNIKEVVNYIPIKTTGDQPFEGKVILITDNPKLLEQAKNMQTDSFYPISSVEIKRREILKNETKNSHKL